MNNLPDKKYPIVVKTCFSEGKLMKQLGNPHLSKRNPPFNLPPISEKFFHDPPLCPNFKNKKHPPNFRGGKETMMLFFKHIETTASEITKEQSVIINTVAGCRTQTYIP